MSSQFLDHKPGVDQRVKGVFEKVPEKWRMPLLLGGPVVLLMLLMPLLFRDERGKAIDARTVGEITKTARTQDIAKAEKEAILDAALASQAAAHQRRISPLLAARAAADAQQIRANPDQAPAVPDQAKGEGASSAASMQGGPPTTMDLKGLNDAHNMSNPTSGGSARSSRVMTAAGPKPVPKPKLRGFGAIQGGIGAGILSGRNQGTASTAAQLAAPPAPARTGGTGGMGGVGGSGAIGGATGTGQGSTTGDSTPGSTGNTGGTGGSTGSGSGTGQAIDTAVPESVKRCQEAQAYYQPKIDARNKSMEQWGKYRADRECDNDIGCYNCNSDQWDSWSHWCGCAYARCQMRKLCREIDGYGCEIKKKCSTEACPVRDCNI
jgi:hypothetical protein